jgi:hypothetical protein
VWRRGVIEAPRTFLEHVVFRHLPTEWELPPGGGHLFHVTAQLLLGVE